MAAERLLVEWDVGSARLRLVEPTPDEVRAHAPALALFYNEPVNRALLTNTIDSTPDDVVDQFAEMRTHGGRPFLLFCDDALLGDCDLRHLDGREAEYAILVGAREVQARGFGTRFTKMAMALAFDGLGLHRIFAAVRPENTGSRRMLAKVGFVDDRSPRARLFAEDEDDLCMSLGRADFMAQDHALSEVRISTRPEGLHQRTPGAS
jgi:RimJ/RimL family protein N-acetyltransferase